MSHKNWNQDAESPVEFIYNYKNSGDENNRYNNNIHPDEDAQLVVDLPQLFMLNHSFEYTDLYSKDAPLFLWRGGARAQVVDQ